MIALDLIRLGGLVFIATSLVVVGDTAGKLLAQQGVAPIFVAWTRFAIAVIILLPLCRPKKEELPSLFNKKVFVRACCIIGGISCILTALKTEPIANVFGAFFIGPIVSYVIAILFLNERSSLTRSLLLALGFVGVLLVVKPGFGMTAGMGFALGAGFFYGCYLAMTRAVAGEYRPRFLLISQLLIGAVLLAPFGLSVQLPTMGSWIIVLIIISALGSAAGNYLLVVANRMGEASLIAPLVYSQLISATIAGVLVFRDWPDVYTFLGLLLILLSGLGSLFLAKK